MTQLEHKSIFSFNVTNTYTVVVITYLGSRPVFKTNVRLFSRENKTRRGPLDEQTVPTACKDVYKSHVGDLCEWWLTVIQGEWRVNTPAPSECVSLPVFCESLRDSVRKRCFQEMNVNTFPITVGLTTERILKGINLPYLDTCFFFFSQRWCSAIVFFTW